MMNKIYANALLSDGEIIFWKTTSGKRLENDFYKDFMYSRINQSEYFENHKMEVKYMIFEFEDNEDINTNNYVFNVLAKEFYRQFPISKDSKGEPAYE